MKPSPVRHLSTEELLAGLAIRRSPKDEGTLDVIVRRPGVGRREVLREGWLDLAEGLVGDSWQSRASARTPDKSAHPDMRLNVMNSWSASGSTRSRS